MSHIPSQNEPEKASRKRKCLKVMGPSEIERKQHQDSSIQSFINFLKEEENERTMQKWMSKEGDKAKKRREEEEEGKRKREREEIRRIVEEDERRRRIIEEEVRKRAEERNQKRRVKDREKRMLLKMKQPSDSSLVKDAAKELESFREARKVVHSLCREDKDRIWDLEGKHEQVFLCAYSAAMKGQSSILTFIVEEIKVIMERERKEEEEKRRKGAEERLEKGRKMLMDSLTKGGIQVTFRSLTEMEREHLDLFMHTYYLLLSGGNGSDVVHKIREIFIREMEKTAIEDPLAYPTPPPSNPSAQGEKREEFFSQWFIPLPSPQHNQMDFRNTDDRRISHEDDCVLNPSPSLTTSMRMESRREIMSDSHLESIHSIDATYDNHPIEDDHSVYLCQSREESHPSPLFTSSLSHLNLSSLHPHSPHYSQQDWNLDPPLFSSPIIDYPVQIDPLEQGGEWLDLASPFSPSSYRYDGITNSCEDLNHESFYPFDPDSQSFDV